MDKEDAHQADLKRLLELFKAMYLRMEQENSWPWVVDPEGWEEFKGLRSGQLRGA